MCRIVLEVIVQSLADAKAARDGGADRLEVVRAIDAGGLTPARDLVGEIASAVDLPLRVMVRENAGFDIRTGKLELLQDAVRWLEAAPIDGIVAGFAAGGLPSLGDLRAVLSAAPRMKVTFHRAFDTLADPEGAIAALAAEAPIDRILTSGGAGSAVERAVRLTRYAALSRLTIVAGGGVDLDAARVFARSRSIGEVHVGRAARQGNVQDAPVRAECVEAVRRTLDRG